MLAEDGFEDHDTIITERHTCTAPFINAEKTEYLVIEDTYANGRPPLEAGGVLYTNRETVDKVERMTNPFMPDAPQRIATDTSQKLPIRFGETVKAYKEKALNTDNLILLTLVLAGYARYLKGIDDEGKVFEPAPDPLLKELQEVIAPCEGGRAVFFCLKEFYGRRDVFGIDLYAAGIGERIEGMVKELYAGPGAVRGTLHKYVSAR